MSKSSRKATIWEQLRTLNDERAALAAQVLEEVQNGMDVVRAIRRHPLPEGGYLPKSLLVAVYQEQLKQGRAAADPALLARIRMKPVRTLSGVTTVTVLTKPYPCPGKCIFCPTDVRMPKSYLPDEPGAMRGLQNQFDPYRQVQTRIEALQATGHPTDKIELLILGGTWSSYRRDYQKWFVQQCFAAMNGEPRSESISAGNGLEQSQIRNETAAHRNVGLVIETRPDEINADELRWLRTLGVTKVQLGAQSLDDVVLERNLRGHTAACTLQATQMLRAAGFKIVLHWMPNLLGATLESDRNDFTHLWSDGYAPDEIKIYPCQLLENADLYQYWLRGEYTPYTQEELIDLLATIKPTIPIYCRVNRVIRDIPSTNVVAGNKRTSLRMDVFEEMARRGTRCQCLRCREVRNDVIDHNQLHLTDTVYAAGKDNTAEEHFLQFVAPSETGETRCAAYLRLSLPAKHAPDLSAVLPDLESAALIREVHVYGQSLAVGEAQTGMAQHAGLGAKLLDEAARIAGQYGYRRLAVIAAVGTRGYYEKRGFSRGALYHLKDVVQ